uniref:Uncharacterized protein n=1 Tax=Coniferiporia sulphurascens TaxID=175648 RepID=A0A5B9RB40_CONSH|nr:hypothetical protein PSUO_000045 [Coniferiporia sulphurascens]QEG57186.1 hypothetical protein PSUO_000045 [Coniferiporia sulphurascens]
MLLLLSVSLGILEFKMPVLPLAFAFGVDAGGNLSPYRGFDGRDAAARSPPSGPIDWTCISLMYNDTRAIKTSIAIIGVSWNWRLGTRYADRITIMFCINCVFIRHF